MKYIILLLMLSLSLVSQDRIDPTPINIDFDTPAKTKLIIKCSLN